jgi:hypothetical protein
MFLSKKLLSPVCIGLISVSVMTPLTVDAKQVRSQVAKNNFKASHPCPSKHRYLHKLKEKALRCFLQSGKLFSGIAIQHFLHG